MPNTTKMAPSGSATLPCDRIARTRKPVATANAGARSPLTTPTATIAAVNRAFAFASDRSTRTPGSGRMRLLLATPLSLGGVFAHRPAHEVAGRSAHASLELRRTLRW